MLQIIAISCLGHSIYLMFVPGLVFIVKEKTSPDHWYMRLKVGEFLMYTAQLRGIIDHKGL